MKTVYSYYVLDVIHSGHILMMKNAKALAGEDGKSIVGILTDKAVMEKKPRPTLSLRERMTIAESIKYVDMVVAQETYSPLSNVENVKPDILIESVSHSKKDIKKARKVMKSLGGKVIVLPYYPLQSSTKIKKRIKNNGRKT